MQQLPMLIPIVKCGIIKKNQKTNKWKKLP